jgi:hypothetical protein
LNHIAKPKETSVCKEGWLSTDDIGLASDNVPLWNSFLAVLPKSHIFLTDEKDYLIWAYNSIGETTLQNLAIGQLSIRLGGTPICGGKNYGRL